MDRKVLLAMVLIMGVLLLDQVISPRFYRPKPKPVPSQQGSGSASTPGTTAPAPSGGTTTAIPSVTTAGPLSAAALIQPEVPAAPGEVRQLKTEHFQATITSEGASITDWVLPGYKDEVRNVPIDLVPPGNRAYKVIVEAGGKALDFSQAPRSEEHTSELQSPCNLVCRLLLEKKK